MPEIVIPGATPVTLHFEDVGEGRPVVLIHGWPLSGEAWATNVPALLGAGYRVITYDRRGFGRSSKPHEGYDYDTLASDLNEVILALDLEGVVLVGFSMGGGEVARYLGTYGGDGRLAGAVFAASVTPALASDEGNPEGAMPQSGFVELAEQCAADREGFLKGFMTTFFSSAKSGLKVTPAQLEEALAITAQADGVALVECIKIWGTDFRADLGRISVPVLVLHGDGDQNVPFAASAQRMPSLIDDVDFHVVKDGPHGINVSHADEFNNALVAFLDNLG